MLSTRVVEVLKRARNTYGNLKQTFVAAEELCELATAILKYGRYDDHDKAVSELKPKVIDELADVAIMVEQIKAVFEITDFDIRQRAEVKADRLERWLNNSKSLELSTEDRVLHTSTGNVPLTIKEDAVCEHGMRFWDCQHCHPLRRE
jgi:NTP pyrophosphatase (non-canonical NTP hydrolase)